MASRRRMSRGASKSNFRSGTYVNGRNGGHRPMRGGFRL